MLKIVIPAREWFDDEKQEFVLQSKSCELMLEHSLLSLSKWESKWKKPFLSDEKSRTDEEFLDYVRCMTINQGVDPSLYYNLTPGNIKEIYDYIGDPMTATTIKRHNNKRPSRAKKIVTSELIYAWMIQYGIPFECQKWHLNRLMMLIDVCSVEMGGSGNKKMSQAEIMRENASLNAMRKAKHKTRG